MTKILLVEDNDINREMLLRRLERKGYEVMVAVNGAAGVAKTRSDQPDLVLMDLHLPVLDGWEATRQIKANPQTRSIPVIALTANAIVGEREKALAAGCDDYETKPVDFTRLIQKITSLLTPTAAPAPPPSVASPGESGQQRRLWTALRQELEPLIYSILGYCDLILDELSDRSDHPFADQSGDQPNGQSDHQTSEAVSSDLQNIQTCGRQLLRLVQAILNPVLLEVQQQDWTIDLGALALRRELLTPLSTIIGYCELLFEEAPPHLIPDLEHIYTSAQELLTIVNQLDQRLTQLLQSMQTIAPKSSGERKTLPLARLQINRSGAAGRVLVVVGHATAGTLLSRQLERLGCQVAIVSTEQQAQQTLAALACDLIVLDASQPDLQWVEILEQVKSHPEWRSIPVLVLVAADQSDQVVQMIAQGAADYLPQPLPLGLLQTKIQGCLEQQQWRSEQAALNQQLKQLQWEVEQFKRGQQATEIAHTGYFQQLQPQPERQDVPWSIDTCSLKVLLVEDNELNCDMLSRRLQRSGYEVVIACDGADGVSKAIAEQPHVILMDISLPIMDGWEATKQLKANPQTCHIPIIALTAHAMTGDREKALAAGCDDYDTKPIEMPRLLGKLEQCLKR